jgi:hypothetical protein
MARIAAAADLPGGPERWTRRIKAMELCGTAIPARVCACGAARPGSGGEPQSPAGGPPCNARACPFCGKRMSRRLARRLVRAAQRVPALARAKAAALTATIGRERAAFVAKQRARVAAGKAPHARWAAAIATRTTKLRELRRVARHYRWSFVTLTVAWEPWDPRATTWEAYRERAQSLWAGIAHAWDEVFNHSGLGVTALFAKLEVNEEGFLHAHCLFYGGVIHKPTLEAALRAADADAGHAKLKPVPRDGVRDAVAEVAKYVVKSVGVLSTAWVANERRAVLHPELAAAVEIGLDGLDAHRSYGVLRGAGLEDADDDQAEDDDASADLLELDDDADDAGVAADDPAGVGPREDDADVACRACGTVGAWATATLRTVVYAQVCRAAGRPLRARARARPPDDG